MEGFQVFDEAVFGYNAVAMCAKNGASLASTHSYAENSFAYGTFLRRNRDHHVLSDLPRGSVWVGLYNENGWRWADDSALDYNHWSPGFPEEQATGSACGYLEKGHRDPAKNTRWANWNSCEMALNPLCSVEGKQVKPLSDKFFFTCGDTERKVLCVSLGLH